MAISKYPSKINLPRDNPGCETVLDYLVVRFPAIDKNVWLKRVTGGKVHWLDGSVINIDTPYRPQQCVCYYREVENEPIVPYAESILFQDENILVAYKPHFLQVTPGGNYVNECLLYRLRKKTGIETLQALHRLDRETAGLVLFSVNAETRALYHALFTQRDIKKTYHAVAKKSDVVGCEDAVPGKEWVVKNRLEKSTPRFLMQIVDGEENAHSLIRLVAIRGDKALFELMPITGKTHQLRVHMQSIGWPIVNDKCYPVLKPKVADDYSLPLQLLAKTLVFDDPVTKVKRHFCCEQDLNW